MSLLLALVAGASIFAWQQYPTLAIGSAYKAKTVCSAIFVSGRDEASVLEEDVHAGHLSRLDPIDIKIDHENRTVTASVYGMVSRTAVFREGIGVTLANDVSVDDLLAEKHPLPAPQLLDPKELWPQGERVDPANLAAIDTIVASAFDEPNPEELLRTRAIVVVRNGRIIAEKYAPGFSHDTPLLGWSMTKSITNALVGIMVRKGVLSLENDELLSLWREADDSRKEITLDQLLHMSSGLEFNEEYGSESDALTMLYRRGDASGFAIDKPLLHTPGSHFAYSSGTTNIICRIIRETIDNDAVYHAFPYAELFHPIGATSAIMERDAKGTFIGSSYMYATARDWARLGLLYANDGVWNGNQRILPEGWVKYSRTLAPAKPNKKHGAHFWLRLADDGDRPDLPKDTFHMSGHEGQFVSIIPEEKLVVVRLGLTLTPGGWKQEKFLARIRKALEN